MPDLSYVSYRGNTRTRDRVPLVEPVVERELRHRSGDRGFHRCWHVLPSASHFFIPLLTKPESDTPTAVEQISTTEGLTEFFERPSSARFSSRL